MMLVIPPKQPKWWRGAELSDLAAIVSAACDGECHWSETLCSKLETKKY